MTIDLYDFLNSSKDENQNKIDLNTIQTQHLKNQKLAVLILWDHKFIKTTSN